MKTTAQQKRRTPTFSFQLDPESRAKLAGLKGKRQTLGNYVLEVIDQHIAAADAAEAATAALTPKPK
jgi:hypothetical protein